MDGEMRMFGRRLELSGAYSSYAYDAELAGDDECLAAWNPTAGFGVPQELFEISYRRQIELVSHNSWTVRPRSLGFRRLERGPLEIRS